MRLRTRNPLWVIVVVVVAVTVPMSTSTPIQTLDCATTSLAGNASAVYLLRDCPAVTIATIANSDLTLLVDNCTVLSAAFALGDVLSNVHLTFTRSIVLTPLKFAGNWSSVANVTVVIDRSNVSYDSWACNVGVGYFVYFQTSEATNITIVMVHSYFEMRNAINAQGIGNSGLFKVYALWTIFHIDSLNITVLNSTVKLLCANITSSDAEITAGVVCRAAFIAIEVPSQVSAIANYIAASVSDSRLTMEGSNGGTVVLMDSLTAVLATALCVTNTAVNVISGGPVDTLATRRGSLFDLNNITASHVNVNSVQLQMTTVAGTVASREGKTSSFVRNVKGMMVAIGGDSSVFVQIDRSSLAVSVTRGQFSYYYANVAAYLVHIEDTSLSMEITVRNCSTIMNVGMTMCPYRRMVQPKQDNPSLLVNMGGLYLNFFAAHLSLQAPLGNVSISVTDSNVSSAFPDMSHCYPMDTTATMSGLTFQAKFITSYTTSSVIIVSARSVAKHSLAMFVGLPPFMLQQIAASPQSEDTVTMPLLFVQNIAVAALRSWDSATLSLDGVTLRCSKLIAPSPWKVSDTSIIPGTYATVRTGPKLFPLSLARNEVALVYLRNVTMGADVMFRLGPYASPILVPLVQAGCTDCGLVAASNGTSLRGSSWVFEGITVDVARGSRFSLFGAAAGGSVVLPSREDVTLQCVRWVGRRLVPFGDGGAMLDRECGGSVSPTTLMPPMPHSGKAPLVATIAVASVTFALLPSVATVVPGIQMVSQLSAMRRMCAVVAAGDGVPPPPLSDAASDPLQVAITSFGAELMYAGGSVVSSLLLWVVFIVVTLGALAVRGRAEWLAVARASSLAVALRLPGSLYAPTMLVLQPLVTASIVLVASSARSGGSATLGVVVLLMTVAPLSIVVARIWRGRKLSLLRWRLVKKGRHEQMSTLRVAFVFASYMFEDRFECVPHGGRESLQHFERYGSVAASFVGEREWFVGVEVLTAVAGGVLSGVALGLDPSVGCSAGVENGLDLSQAALLCGVLLAVVVLRPYASRFGNVLSGVSLLLSALCLVLQALAPDTSDGAVSAMTWAQVALGILPLLWLPVCSRFGRDPMLLPHFPQWPSALRDGARDGILKQALRKNVNSVQSFLRRADDGTCGSVDWRAENLEVLVQCICQKDTKMT